jgi:TatD DNase family protein
MGGASPLFDVHCHAADARLAHCDMLSLLDEARAVGVRQLVVNGTCEGDWARVAELADTHRGSVIASFGLHPWRVAAATPRWADELQAVLMRHPRAALGEAGLHHGRSGAGCDATAAQQAAALATQLRMATQLRRPISLHCVRASGALHEQLLAACPKASGYHDTGLLLHGYSGSAEMVPRFAALGAHFSFSAALGGMAPARAAALVRAVPDDRLLLETDAPDGLPRGDGGVGMQLRYAPAPPQRLAFGSLPCGCDASDEDEVATEREAPPLNHPANLRAVLQLVARLRGVEEEALAALAWRNSRRLFAACLDDHDSSSD